MASRKEQKARAREARLAAERAAAEQARRTRRLRYAITGAAMLAALIVVVIVLLSASPSTPSVPIPAQQAATLTTAAAVAGCQVKSYAYDNRTDRAHVPDGTKVHYKSDPPSFGPHYATPAPDGNYVGRATPPTGNLVHALEHGRIETQYRAGLPAREVGQLQTLFNQSAGAYGSGQYELLFQNATNMPSAVAAAAWAHTLTCPTFNPRVFDALRAFRAKFTLKGPEAISQPE